ncbi:integrase, catalytic region, zinc finger, CCHC-type containing protein [Tanacetum coccineum]
MSTSKTYQQSLADVGSETRPPMLERGSYIPWASRFRRYINRKRENQKWLNKALDEGPYQFEMFIPNDSTVPKLQTAKDLQGDALLLYDAEMELMNLILLSIPNDIYNSVDACTSAKDMWKRVERLMRGTIQNKVDRETRFTNEFDQFVAEPGEALVSVYNRFAHSKTVNVSRAKKLEKSHDPLALVAHTGSSSRNTSSYYVTHPTFVVDYEDEYHQDDVHTNFEDPLAFAMLTKQSFKENRVNISKQELSNAGRIINDLNVHEEIIEGSNAPNETGNVQRTLRTSSSGNTLTVQCYNCSGKGHYARNCPKAKVSGLEILSMEQNVLQNREEAGVEYTDELNDFLFADASRMEEIDELSANICLMAIIQPADNTSDAGPSYDSAFINIIRDLEKQRDKLDLDVKDYKRKNEELQKTHSIVKRQMSKNEDRYHDTVLDLEAKLKKNVDLILKLSNSIQGMFMLGPKPFLGNSDISLSVRDTKDTLDDASKSQQQTLFLKKSFLLSKKYFPSSFIPSDKNPKETLSIPASMPNLKTRLTNVEKGKSVNTKFDKTNGSQPLLCVTPLNKHVIQKKTDVQKSEENHVVSKPVTLQTSPSKQRGVNSNKNIIAPGMYKVVTTHESQTNEAKHDLSSTGMNAASSVRRPMNRDSHVKNSILANFKKPAKKVTVYVRKNKQTDNTSENLISNKENVTDVDVANASKAKTLLCVSCMQNVLIPCHDNCFANYKLNVHSNVRRNLSTKSRTPKSYDTTYVVHKARFSKESTLSKSLDTTYVVSKPKIDVGSTSKANDKWLFKSYDGDRSLLKNFNEKFMGTVHFGNDNFVAITGYGDYIQGNITICHVYYVEGLGHNLFSVGQFCDGDLEVAFHSKTCYVRNLEGDDLLTGGRESNLYTISISDMAASSPVCLMSKATSTKSWLWHRRLSHLNFDTINDLTRLELVDGLPKFKYGKDHLCSACERGKSKKDSHPLKIVLSDHSKLELLHMDLCGLMRVASINGKKYILMIVDDYSRYTWVYFLHSKDETP